MIVQAFDYITDAQRLLREAKQEMINPADLLVFVNRARREIAMRAMCVRTLTPIAGAIVSASVTSGGSGYVSGSVTVTASAPDFPSGTGAFPGGKQAVVGTPVVTGGSLASVTMSYGGSGYFNPVASITSPTGTGASVAFQLSPINTLTANQEVYPYSGIDLTQNPGYDSVYFVQSISVIYANYRYSLPVYPFSVYQAYVRQYPFQYTYVPTIASQKNEGTGGSFYVYPLPSQTYQYELDCFCLPSNLTLDNLAPEAIPQPWTDSVAFYTCFMAMMSIQNYNAAKFYQGLFDEFAQRHSNYARRGRMFNPYGRY